MHVPAQENTVSKQFITTWIKGKYIETAVHHLGNYFCAEQQRRFDAMLNNA